MLDINRPPAPVEQIEVQDAVGHRWSATVPANVTTAVRAAAFQALRCPRCGATPTGEVI